MIDAEEWRPIEDWRGLYEVSNLGRIRSLPREVARVSRYGKLHYCQRKGRVRKLIYDDDGMARVELSEPGRTVKITVAQTVLTTFVGPNPGECCARHHGSKFDNSAPNLFWGTEPTDRGSVSKSERDARIVNALREWGSVRRAAKELGLSENTVARVKKHGPLSSAT